jgi:hypothetical protein
MLYNNKHDTSVTPADLKTWDFEKVEVKDARGNVVKGAELRKMFLDYEAHGLYAAMPALPGAQRAIDTISKLGYKIIVLTARDEKYRIQTEINMTLRGIKCDELVMDWDKVKRINALKDKYRIIGFADDKFATVQSVAEECDLPHNFLVDKAHNRDIELPEDVIRIQDLFDIIRYLK